MIKTPVKFDSFDGICGIFDRTGNVVVFTDEDVTKDDANEIVKRINMHDELVKRVKQLSALSLVDMGSAAEWISNHLSEIDELLEQCK